MIPYRFHFIGLQLFVLVYTAQSFVLLTANMEDIKKIARNFVSESLADKIAEFVVQATEQISEKTPNVSEENDMNQDISDNRYKLRNIARERIENTHKTRDYNEYKYQPRTTPASTTRRDIDKIEAKSKYWQKQRNEISHERFSVEEHPKYNNKYPQKDERKQKYRPNKSREVEYKEYKYKENSASESGKRHSSSSKYKTTEKRGLIKLSALDSVESRDVRSDYDRKTSERNERESETTRFRGLRAVNTVETTTVKQKTDFDQYDNPKYPKAEYIATSGPVMLPRMKSQREEKAQSKKKLTSSTQNETWMEALL